MQQSREILVVFGSASDTKVYGPLMDELRKRGLSADFRVCSAHKSPRYLQEILAEADERYALIIAGAGLAAHLGGVIASRTILPVIGIPCSGALDGADALLSTMQMPPHVPVLAVGVNQFLEAAAAAERILEDPSLEPSVLLVGVPAARLKAVQELCARFGLRCQELQEAGPNPRGIVIRGVPLTQQGLPPPSGIEIRVPVAERTSAADIPTLLTLTREGLWVGINRFENAVIAAAQILNRHGTLTEELLIFKKELEEMIRASH